MFDMLNVAIEYKAAVQNICGDDVLARYRLTNLEWTTLEHVRDVSQVRCCYRCLYPNLPSFPHQALKDATVYFSRSAATVVSVIPAIDKLDNVLATAIMTKAKDEHGNTETIEFSPPVRAALLVAKRTLNRYYNLTDDSEIYHICISIYHYVVFDGFYLIILCSLTPPPQDGLL